MTKSKTNDDFNKIGISEQYGLVYGFNFKKAEIWYNLAEENLVTSRILLDNHRYAHAAFFMQQCVECFTKGVLIHSNVVSPDKVKAISHDIEGVISVFYSKLGDEYDLNVIQNIHSKLLDYESFSDKCTMVVIPCVNNLIEQFEKTVKCQTLGFHTINGYVTNVLILLSLLLDHSTQQSTRYYENYSYPHEKYTACSQLDKILIYLTSVNEWIKFLSKKKQE